jgi:hypothetical protein
MELQEKLEDSERKCKVLQEQVDELTLSFARQIAQLKAKMTEQGAMLMISASSSDSAFLPPSISPSLHKSGVLKKKTTSSGSSARLEPIDNYGRMSSSIQYNEGGGYEESSITHGRNPGR